MYALVVGESAADCRRVPEAERTARAGLDDMHRIVRLYDWLFPVSGAVSWASRVPERTGFRWMLMGVSRYAALEFRSTGCADDDGRNGSGSTKLVIPDRSGYSNVRAGLCDGVCGGN